MDKYLNHIDIYPMGSFGLVGMSQSYGNSWMSLFHAISQTLESDPQCAIY